MQNIENSMQMQNMKANMTTIADRQNNDGTTKYLPRLELLSTKRMSNVLDWVTKTVSVVVRRVNTPAYRKASNSPQQHTVINAPMCGLDVVLGFRWTKDETTTQQKFPNLFFNSNLIVCKSASVHNYSPTDAQTSAAAAAAAETIA